MHDFRCVSGQSFDALSVRVIVQIGYTRFTYWLRWCITVHQTTYECTCNIETPSHGECWEGGQALWGPLDHTMFTISELRHTPTSRVIADTCVGTNDVKLCKTSACLTSASFSLTSSWLRLRPWTMSEKWDKMPFSVKHCSGHAPTTKMADWEDFNI